MTDDNDLVKQLRAAAKHPLMDNNCIAAVFDVSDAADRIEALEAKLAKAVKALDRIAGKAPYADDPYDIARAALAELKGDKP